MKIAHRLGELCANSHALIYDLIKLIIKSKKVLELFNFMEPFIVLVVEPNQFENMGPAQVRETI